MQGFVLQEALCPSRGAGAHLPSHPGFTPGSTWHFLASDRFQDGPVAGTFVYDRLDVSKEAHSWLALLATAGGGKCQGPAAWAKGVTLDGRVCGHQHRCSPCPLRPPPSDLGYHSQLAPAGH